MPLTPLRFFLDNDVDARCGHVLRSKGHEAWTASDAGRSDADDDDQAIYAQDRGAVLLTHDRAFTNRRRLMPIGRHVRLLCDQPDGPELLKLRLADEQLVETIRRTPNIVVILQWNGHSVQYGTEHRQR